MSVVKKFSKTALQDLVCEDSTDLEVIIDKVVDNSRWSVHHKLVFLDTTTEKFYETSYSRGATEMQDESPSNMIAMKLNAMK